MFSLDAFHLCMVNFLTEIVVARELIAITERS